MRAVIRLSRSILFAGLVLSVGWIGAAAQEAVPTRDQIDDANKWDLTKIYADVAAWEADYAKAEQILADLTAEKDKQWKIARNLSTTLRIRDAAYWTVDRLVVYATQLHHQDMREPGPQALAQRAAALKTKYEEAAAWVEPRIQATPSEKIDLWLTSNWLTHHKHYVINVVRQKAHTLSQEEEKLLAMMGNLAASPRDTYEVLKNTEVRWPAVKDADGNDVTLSPARFNKFIRSADRRLRRDAFMAAMETFSRYRRTFAATLNGALQRDWFLAQARGFDSALQSTLYPDNLPVSVYTNLVAAVNAHLPLLHRWAALRKQMTGLAELHVYDLYQPLVKAADRDIPYEDAVAAVKAALAPLGPEYCEIMNQGFASRWIDVYETQGKRPGGYSWGSYTTPPYILLNYNGTPRDMSTLAHEMGHAMHSFLTHKNQPPAYAQYSYFVAEVASIFNEILLEEYLLNSATTPHEKLRLLNDQIDNFRSTVFRQTMFAEFEEAAHQRVQRGEPITAEALGALYLDTFYKYWGPDVVRDPWQAPYWARIPHFYRNHYVYRYATSYCAAAALAEGVLADKPGARDAYLTFLKAGSSDYPLELLKKAGVDMTSPAPIQAAMQRFEHMLDEFETLLNEH